MSASSTEDLYRSYRAVEAGTGGDAAAALFVARYLRSVLEPARGHPIFEIGAGTGATLRALRRAGFSHAVGIDISASQVEQARAQGTDVALGDGLAALAAYPPGSLGAILLLDVLEHLNLEEVLRLLRLAADRLRPGGLLVARVPNGAGLFGGAVLHADITHQRAFTSRSLAQAFALGGLETAAMRSVRPMAHGIASALRWLAWVVVEALVRTANAAEAGGFDAHVTRNILGVGRRQA